jgi:hypothetical protein
MRTFSLDRPITHALFTSLIGLLGAACANTIVGGGAGGGGGGEPPLTTSTSTTTGWTTTVASTTTTGGGTTTVSTTTGGGTTTVGTTTGGWSGCASGATESLPSTACTPQAPICGASSSVCLATAHAHGAPVFGLRMAHITLDAPKALTQGVVKSIFEGSTRPNLAACNVSGQGTFNWLLRVDTNAGTITVGAGKPVADPSSGYAFVNGPVQLGNGVFPVAPATTSASLAPSCDFSTGAVDVLLPFYGDLNGNTMTLFPLRSLRFLDTRVTPDHDCIGAYDAAGLSPANACQPDAQTPDYLDDGRFESFITLEDADKVLVPPLNETLCVVLSGDPATYGDNSQPRRCKRDSRNHIVLPGDWCSANDQPANGGCADAMRFAGSFAASGTLIP